MSGHNKWSTIKHKKGKADAARGKVFTKLIKEITVAARMGGSDPTGNPRLRTALDAARVANMPKDNIDRAIKKGTGELEGVIYEEIVYEGYGPSGVAVLLECMTDNKNRTVPELRKIFSKFGGNLGESGCVGWMFDSKGVITINREGVDGDLILEHALEAGAEDVKESDEEFEVITSMEDFETVKAALEGAGLAFESAELTRIPQTTINLTGKHAEQMLRMMDTLDDHDDVQNVYANYEIDDAELESALS